MAPIEILGIVATCLTTPAYIPQAVKILRTRDTRAISLGMYVLLTIGTLLWLIYGIAIASPGLILGNSIALVFTAAILALKIKHG